MENKNYFILVFSDYHEIPNITGYYNTVNKKLGITTRLKGCELDNSYYDGVIPYLGLFWTGKKPSKAEVKKRIKSLKF